MLFLIGQLFQSLAIIQLHALYLLQKTLQIRDQFLLYMDPKIPAITFPYFHTELPPSRVYNKIYLRKVKFKKLCFISYLFRLCRSFVVNLFIFYNLGFPRDILLIVYTADGSWLYMYIFENEV